MGGTWLIGALINLVGSIMINLGTNVMKLGHNKRAAMESRIGKEISIRIFREWQIGVVFFVFGNLANFISFGYAAQSLLAALGSVQFVSNVAFASLVLREKVTLNILWATVCIVTGCVMLVLFGSHASEEFTVDEMMHLYTAPAYITYLIFLGSCVILMYPIYKCGKKKMLSVGITGLSHCWYRLLPISYAIFSGMIGTQSVLFSKTLSTLLRVTLGGNSQIESWFTWVIIILFLITSTFWITRLNKALKFFPAMMIVPTMQISWTFFSIVSGMLYFQEYKDFTMWNGIMFAIAVMIIFFGVFLLTKMRAIEQRLSSRLTECLEDEKMRAQSESDETPMGHSVVNGLLVKVRDVPWDDVDDVQCPIVGMGRPDGHTSSPSKTNNYGDLPIRVADRTTRPESHLVIIEDDEDTVTHPRECPQCIERSLLETVAEDFSIDIWTSVKGTVGMGSESVPGVTLFGPPGVGLENPPTHLSVNCTSKPDEPIVHLTSEGTSHFDI